MKRAGLGLKAQIEAEKAAVAPAPPRRDANPKSGGREGKKALIAYFSPQVSKTLGRMAIDEDTTMQALIGEAIDLLMDSRGKDSIRRTVMARRQSELVRVGQLELLSELTKDYCHHAPAGEADRRRRQDQSAAECRRTRLSCPRVGPVHPSAHRSGRGPFLDPNQRERNARNRPQWI